MPRRSTTNKIWVWILISFLVLVLIVISIIILKKPSRDTFKITYAMIDQNKTTNMDKKSIALKES
jgi:hypothetical protein